jgi:mono/diheme cytochrome c family protein
MRSIFRALLNAAAVVTVAAAPVLAEVPAAEPQAAPAAEVIGSGDFDAGKRLFTGETRLKNGGPACISCHNAGTTAAWGGGTLGPDLTTVWVEKSFLIDANWINSEGVPVMGPIFSRKNITEEEVEHLKTFFSTVSTQTAATPTSKFVGWSIVGTVIMLIIFSIIWGNRYRKRNQGTAHDALWRNYGGKGGR